jgi:hypothetical protein
MSEVLRTYEVVVEGTGNSLCPVIGSTLHLGVFNLETHCVQNTVKVTQLKDPFRSKFWHFTNTCA